VTAPEPHSYEFGNHTRRTRRSGGITRTFVTGVSDVRRRPSGEALMAIDTEAGEFFAVAYAVSYYGARLVGARVEINWLMEGGTRVTREPPLILAARPAQPKPTFWSWEQHHRNLRVQRQRAEADQPGNECAVRAQMSSKCPECGRWVEPGDPITPSFEGWCHARCAAHRLRHPKVCPLCGSIVWSDEEPWHTGLDTRHLACVAGRPRSKRT
jgi:hypothetical protein